MAPVLVLTLSILASVVTSVLLKGRFAPCTALAIAVPQRIYDWLTFDFEAAGKIRAGKILLPEKERGRIYPNTARFAAHVGRICLLF
jgi:hypothetical protein